jgi:hypothetical protein
MNLYLDEDSASPLLAQLLRQAAYDVQLPADVGLVGRNDPIQLTNAIRQGRVLLTGNYDAFENLHDLIRQAGGHHPGILVIRRDNDPKRDLTARGIVVPIKNLLTANVPLLDQFIILNHWR